MYIKQLALDINILNQIVKPHYIDYYLNGLLNNELAKSLGLGKIMVNVDSIEISKSKHSSEEKIETNCIASIKYILYKDNDFVGENHQQIVIIKSDLVFNKPLTDRNQFDIVNYIAEQLQIEILNNLIRGRIE